MLTDNFSLSEFAVSGEFPQLAERIGFSDVQRERIRFACSSILEPLREHFAQPVYVTSGKRTVELNKQVGGHPRSDHLFFKDQGAVDIVMRGITPVTIANWLVNNVVTKLVVAYLNPCFIHISFPDSTGQINKLRIQS